MEPGTPLRLPTHNGDLMVAALRQHRNRPIVHLGEVSLTGAETAARISQYIQAFEALGAGTGTHAALLALNRPEVLFILGAGQTQGYRRTSLHPLGSADDHAYVINDAGITALIIDPYFVERALQLLEKCPGLTQVLTIGPVPEALAAVGVDLVAKAAEFDPQPLTAALLPPDHITSITYTGGTTGKPKGVVGLSSSFNTMTQIQLAEWEWPENPRFLMCTPLSHAGAAFFVPVVIKGGTLHVLPRFDPAEVLRTIEEQRITATMLVPTMLYALMDHPDSRTRDLSSLETVYYGASAINPARLAEAIERFGPIFAQYYGQSEAPMVITYLGKQDHVSGDDRRLTVVRTAVGVHPRRAAGRGRHARAAGEPGEICVSGPLLSGGYWKLPDETAATFRDGWLHTGDVAREDEDGYWYIVDRTKDMIVTGGFNVFPREVEDIVAEHPMVAQVGVIGVPHEKFGEAVTAVVVLRADAARDDDSLARMTAEIQQAVKDRKGSVQAPKDVLVRDELPLTPLGKPDKKALRAQFWTGERAVG